MVRTLHFTPKWSPSVSLMLGGVEIFLTSDLITSIDEKFAPQPQPVEPQPVEPQPNVFIVFIS